MKIKHMNIHNKDHISIDYDITRACNNRCPYCCELDYLDNAKIFNPEVFEQVIESINNYKYTGKFSVSLLGGDPLIVPEKVKEFVQRINAKVTVYSNLNFPPTSKNIQLVKDLDCKFINSIHDSSIPKNVKANILQLKNKVIPIIMIRPEGIDLMLEYANWLIENKIPYKVQFIRDEIDTVKMDLKDERVTKIFNGSIKNIVDTIDDKTFTEIESLEADLMNIATRHKVICQLYMCRVKFDGKIATLCSNPIDYGHVKNGFHFKELMCSNNHCLCDTRNYKRILS